MNFRLKLYHRLEKERDNQFLSLLEKKPSAKVVDLGCGAGDFTLKIKEKIQCNEIIGVTFTKKQIRICSIVTFC